MFLYSSVFSYLFSDILSQLSHDLVKDDQLSDQGFGLITWPYERLFIITEKHYRHNSAVIVHSHMTESLLIFTEDGIDVTAYCKETTVTCYTKFLVQK